MDWLKKNYILVVLNLFSTIIGGMAIMAFSSTMSKIDTKADKIEVDNQFKQHEILEDEKFKTIEIKIDNNEKRDLQTRELFLYEIRELRKDWKLKTN